MGFKGDFRQWEHLLRIGTAITTPFEINLTVDGLGAQRIPDPTTSGDFEFFAALYGDHVVPVPARSAMQSKESAPSQIGHVHFFDVKPVVARA